MAAGKRKAIQLVSVTYPDGASLFLLADDGTVWNLHPNGTPEGIEWVRTPDLPQGNVAPHVHSQACEGDIEIVPTRRH